MISHFMRLFINYFFKFSFTQITMNLYSNRTKTIIAYRLNRNGTPNLLSYFNLAPLDKTNYIMLNLFRQHKIQYVSKKRLICNIWSRKKTPPVINPNSKRHWNLKTSMLMKCNQSYIWVANLSLFSTVSTGWFISVGAS